MVLLAPTVTLSLVNVTFNFSCIFSWFSLEGFLYLLRNARKHQLLLASSLYLSVVSFSEFSFILRQDLTWFGYWKILALEEGGTLAQIQYTFMITLFQLRFGGLI